MKGDFSLKVKKGLIILCFILVGIAIVGIYSYEKNSSENKVEGKKMLNEDIYKKKSDKELISITNELTKKMKLDLGKLYSKDITEDGLDSKNFRQLNFENGFIILNVYTGQLRFLNINNDYINNKEEKEIDDKELLNKATWYYNILMNKKNYKLDNPVNDSQEYKTFSWNLKISEDLTSKYNVIEITIAKNTGALKSINILDSKITNDLSQIKISKEKAEKIIEKFILVNQYTYSGKISMEIVRYNNNISEETENFDKSRIAWVGEIEDKNNNKWLVHVDSTDGIVIGGDCLNG